MDAKAFFKFSYGLYILSSHYDGKSTGSINNTCFQVTAEPAQFAVCTHKDNLTTDLIDKSGSFVISVIQEDVDMEFIGNWGFNSGNKIDKFAKANYKIGKSGYPIVLDNAIAYLECKVTQKMDVGSHIIFIGRVEEAEILKEDIPPLTYKYYQEVIKGVSPKNAPTYVAEKSSGQLREGKESEEAKASDEWVCSVCGYVYDPQEGDPTSGIAPGTPFEDLPEDWRCPICGAEKDMFSRV